MLKKTAQFVFLVLALVPYGFHKIEALFLGRERSFEGISQFLALVPGLYGSYLRVAFYRLTMQECPQSCEIDFLTSFASPETRIGGNTIISVAANIGRVSIGEDCLIGAHVMITSGKNQHRFDRRDVPIRLQGGEFNPVTIGRDCWIGNGAVIMADVGEGSVVAAGSVVIKPIPPYSIAAGSPARVIGERGCSPT